MSIFAASPPEPKSKIPILAKSSSLPERSREEGARSKAASDLAGDFARQLNMERDNENNELLKAPSLLKSAALIINVAIAIS
jgi:hypothetical protein